MRKCVKFLVLVMVLIGISAVSVQAWVQNSDNTRVMGYDDAYLNAIARKDGNNSYAYASNSGEHSGLYIIEGSCAKNYNVNDDNRFAKHPPASFNYSMYKGYTSNSNSDIFIAQIMTSEPSPNYAAYAQAQ